MNKIQTFTTILLSAAVLNYSFHEHHLPIKLDPPAHAPSIITSTSTST